MPTHLHWAEDGELHPEELVHLQDLLSPCPRGQQLEFQALERFLTSKPEDQESIRSVR